MMMLMMMIIIIIIISETNYILSSKEIPTFYGNLIFFAVYTTAHYLFLP